MNKIKEIVNKSWFKSAVIGLIATLVLIEGSIFYAGLAYGFAIREFLFGLKVYTEEDKNNMINS